MSGARSWASWRSATRRAAKSAPAPRIRWLPDLDVFTDIDIPADYYRDVMKRQAVVNAGVTFRLRNETAAGKFETEEFVYENGIEDYVRELAGQDALTDAGVLGGGAQGARPGGQAGVQGEAQRGAVLLQQSQRCANTTTTPACLEHGGSAGEGHPLGLGVAPSTSTCETTGKYAKSEAKITFPDVQDCLILVTSSFSTQTSYENQTKKAITNKFIQEAMTEFLRSRLEIYFIENQDAAEKIAAQVLINKRSRETAEAHPHQP